MSPERRSRRSRLAAAIAGGTPSSSSMAAAASISAARRTACRRVPVTSRSTVPSPAAVSSRTMSSRSQSSQPGGAGGLQRLDHGRGQALEEDAAQQLAGRRRPGLGVHHLDVRAERAEQVAHVRGAVPAGQHRGAEPAPRHRRHDRDIGEPGAARPRRRGQFPLQPRRPGVEVGPDHPVADRADARLEGRGGVVRAVDAQDEVGAVRGVGLAAGADHPLRRRDGRVVPAHDRPGRDEVAPDRAARLTEPENRDGGHTVPPRRRARSSATLDQRQNWRQSLGRP